MTAGLETDWAAFAGRALDAATMTLAARAARQGDRDAAAAGHRGALPGRRWTASTQSDATIAQARGLRDRAREDLGRLDPHDLDRPQRRPTTRRSADLYDALHRVEGPRDRPGARGVRRRAGGAGAAARATPAALVVIMSDIAQGGLNQAVISIEQARGALSTALDVQHQLQQPPASPRSRLRRGGPRRGARPPVHSPASFQPRPACPGAQPARGGQPEDLRADPRRHRPAVGGPDGRPRGPGRRRARLRGRLRRARPPIRRRARARSRRSASCAAGATRRRSARPASSPVKRVAGRSRRATPRTSTARPCASSPPRAIRRLINRDVKAMAVWLDPLAEALGGDVGAGRRRRRARRRRGRLRAQDDLPRGQRRRAAGARRARAADRARRDAAALAKAAERGRIIGEGANVARRLSNRAANDVTPQVLADEARAHRRGQRAHDRRRRREARRRAGHGHVPRRGAGERQPAADDRDAVGRRRREGRAGPAPRDGRQGRLLRLGRHQHQAGRPDGRDEDGQDRCVHRDRGHRHRRPAVARAAAARASRRRSRTCPAAARPGPATSSRR